MKPDLHCHSHYSDGSHSPEFLMQRALENNVTHLAITDHDYITWQDKRPAFDSEIELIPGVEISADWNGKEIHVVGLFIDAADTALNQMLQQQRQARKLRIARMDEKLNTIGIHGLSSYLENLPCEAWTRSHVAQFLIEEGHCKNWQRAFKQFLSRKGKAYSPIQWQSLDEVATLITNAGGIAILAHPGRYSLNKTKLEKLGDDFKAAGGEAIEGSYGNIDLKTKKQLSELACNKGLYLSIGSDFHDADRHWTDIGKAPALNCQATKNAIWDHPRWHSEIPA